MKNRSAPDIFSGELNLLRFQWSLYMLEKVVNDLKHGKLHIHASVADGNVMEPIQM